MQRMIDKLFSLLLVCLGFSVACDVENGPIEYGSPHADYQVSGRVRNTVGTPVAGIEVNAIERYGPDNEYEHVYAETSTGAAGDYTLVARVDGGRRNDTIVLRFRDIDGEANGLYREQTDTVVMTGEFTGRDGWYLGKKTAAHNATLVEEQEQ